MNLHQIFPQEIHHEQVLGILHELVWDGEVYDGQDDLLILSELVQLEATHGSARLVDDAGLQGVQHALGAQGYREPDDAPYEQSGGYHDQELHD